MALRNYAKETDGDSVVSQRLKRMASTVEKLRRFPRMKLSRMQDIGGCRAIVGTVHDVRRLQERYRHSRTRHLPVNGKDYIESPKESGYRGVHLVYRYRSDRSEVYNGLLIEIQLRSTLQHAWAMAVETASVFLGQALKSSEGERAWLRFFALAGSCFAEDEGCAPVPGTPSGLELRTELGELGGKLDVLPKLGEYQELIHRLPIVRSVKGEHFLLLERRPDQGRLYVTGFRRNELIRADEEYRAAESRVRDIPGAEAVLVSADSIEAVRRAYPRYALDSKRFVARLTELVPGLRS